MNKMGLRPGECRRAGGAPGTISALVRELEELDVESSPRIPRLMVKPSIRSDPASTSPSSTGTSPATRRVRRRLVALTRSRNERLPALPHDRRARRSATSLWRRFAAVDEYIYLLR